MSKNNQQKEKIDSGSMSPIKPKEVKPTYVSNIICPECGGITDDIKLNVIKQEAMYSDKKHVNAYIKELSNEIKDLANDVELCGIALICKCGARFELTTTLRRLR